MNTPNVSILSITLFLGTVVSVDSSVSIVYTLKPFNFMTLYYLFDDVNLIKLWENILKTCFIIAVLLLWEIQ